MRTLLKNQQKMYYALYKGSEPTYVLDENNEIVYEYYEDSDGNKIYYLDDDGNRIPTETGENRNVYENPVEFYGNIAMSGGESEAVEYGLDMSQYSAVLIVSKGSIPITETSRIWHTTEPAMNKYGTVDEFSADYTVVKVSPSLNYDKYILQRVNK